MPDRAFFIFVVLMDELDHFVVNSLTLDSPYEECRETSFGSNLPTDFVFYGATSVFNIICPDTIDSNQDAV
jgi:hypothetical protein